MGKRDTTSSLKMLEKYRWLSSHYILPCKKCGKLHDSIGHYEAGYDTAKAVVSHQTLTSHRVNTIYKSLPILPLHPTISPYHTILPYPLISSHHTTHLATTPPPPTPPQPLGAPPLWPSMDVFICVTADPRWEEAQMNRESGDKHKYWGKYKHTWQPRIEWITAFYEVHRDSPRLNNWSPDVPIYLVN